MEGGLIINQDGLRLLEPELPGSKAPILPPTSSPDLLAPGTGGIRPRYCLLPDRLVFAFRQLTVHA